MTKTLKLPGTPGADRIKRQRDAAMLAARSTQTR